MKTVLDALELLDNSSKTINARESKVVEKINDLYHIIEMVDLPAHKMMQVTKELKSTLRLRRDLKEERSMLQAIGGRGIKVSLAQDLRLRRDNRTTAYAQESKESYQRIFAKDTSNADTP